MEFAAKRRKNYWINLLEFGAEGAGTKNYRISPRSGDFFQKIHDFYRISAKITGILHEFEKKYWINAAEGGEKITGIPETLKKTLLLT